jgi:hypothetical protein
MDSIHFSIDSDGSVYLSRDDEAGCHAPNGGTPAQGQGPSRGPAGGRALGALGWQRRRHDVSFPQKKLEIIEIN